MNIYSRSLYIAVAVLWIFLLSGPFAIFFRLPDDGEPPLPLYRYILMAACFLAWCALAFYIAYQFRLKNNRIKTLQHKLINEKFKQDPLYNYKTDRDIDSKLVQPDFDNL